MFQDSKMRFLFLFLPAVVIPLTFQIMSSGQPFSTTTVDTQEKPLQTLNLLPQTTPVTPKVNVPHPPTSAKKQSQKAVWYDGHNFYFKKTCVEVRLSNHEIMDAMAEPVDLKKLYKILAWDQLH